MPRRPDGEWLDGLPELLPTFQVAAPGGPLRVLDVPGFLRAPALLDLLSRAADGDWARAPGERKRLGRLARAGLIELDRPTHFRRYRLTGKGRATLAGQLGGGLGPALVAPG